MNKEAYLAYVKKNAPKTREGVTLLTAFFVGGVICAVGQFINLFITNVFSVVDKEQAGAFTSMTLILIGSVLTGLGLYDKLGSVAGGGSIIPITGFANSMVSPAMEYNREGVILGVMTKMFTIAGPVIISGVVASIIVGLIYLLVGAI